LDVERSAFLKKSKHPTSNVERPTSNSEGFASRHPTLDAAVSA
jgi:hypothetical protein